MPPPPRVSRQSTYGRAVDGRTATRVFVSFRNGDAPYAAAVLYHALADRLGGELVFRSSNSLPLAARWAETIWEHHHTSEVVVVIIGPHWLSVTDSAGRQRLWQDDDWVRQEVARALAAGKEIAPVLIAGVPRLSEDDLPESIADLAAFQSRFIDHRDLVTTTARVVDAVVDLLDPPPGPPPAGRDAGGWLRVWNVPARLPVFTEREALVAALREDLLAAGGGWPVVLHGGVGTGKSQLAMEYAYRYAGDHHLAWWIDATTPELVWSQLAALGREVGFAPEAEPPEAVRLMARELHRRGRWLLILDGVEDPAAAREPLAALGSGADVLITSRRSDWGLAAARRPVGTFERDQSVSLLGHHLPAATAPQLERLAAAVDDIPLALAQAAAFLDGATIGLDQYVELLRTRTRELLDRDDTRLYPVSIAAAWSVALERLRSHGPDAIALLELLSVVAPEEVPLDRLRSWPDGLPDPLGRLADVIRRDDAVRAVASSGLVPVAHGRPRPHGLFQSYLRCELPEATLAQVRHAAGRVLARVSRPDPREPAAWEAYPPLLPHAIALDLAATPDPACHELLLDVAHHLVVRGDPAAARDLVEPAVTRWREAAGPDAPVTLAAMARLAQAAFQLRDFPAALALDEEVLRRRRRSMGDDHPDTLEAAHSVAIGRYAVHGAAAAGDLAAQVVAGRTRVLGADHPDTLRSLQNQALLRRATGDLAGARELDERAWLGLREVLRADHPDTLRSAHALALDLRALGRSGEARPVAEDTYHRRAHVLGADHPDTLRSAYGLVLDLRASGDPAPARLLAEQTWRRQARVLGDTHMDTVRTAYLLAELAEPDDPDAARRLREQAAGPLHRLAGVAGGPATPAGPAGQGCAGADPR